MREEQSLCFKQWGERIILIVVCSSHKENIADRCSSFSSHECMEHLSFSMRFPKKEREHNEKKEDELLF